MESTEFLYQIFWTDHALERLVSYKEARGIVGHHMATCMDPIWLVPANDPAALNSALKSMWLCQHLAPERLVGQARSCGSLDSLWCHVGRADLLWMAERALSLGSRRKLVAQFACRLVRDTMPRFEFSAQRYSWVGYIANDMDAGKLDHTRPEFWGDKAGYDAALRECQDPAHRCVITAVAAMPEARLADAADAARDGLRLLAEARTGATPEEMVDETRQYTEWQCQHIRENYKPDWLLPPAPVGGVA